MIKIIFKYNGKEIPIEANVGDTLLGLARKAKVPIIAGCGGAGVCGSCMVNIDENYLDKLNEISSEEQDILDYLPSYKQTSRLACQVIVNDKMDGLVVSID